MQSEERLRAVERATDMPLLVLALGMIPPLIIPELVDLSGTAKLTVVGLDWLIWGAFAAVFGLKVAVAPRRLDYVRRHPLEAAMVVLPFLRPLRLLRFLRFARLAAALGVNVSLIRSLAVQRGTRTVVAVVLVCLVVGASGAYLAERDEPEANITSYDDAIWWAATTMTTVGYGDRYPTTPEGRGIAIALMLFGIAALSALTAVVAAMLVREKAPAEEQDVLEEIKALRAELQRLREDLNQ